MVLMEIFGGKMETLTGGWRKLQRGFGRMGFVVIVRHFGGTKITGKILSEILKAVSSCRLKE